MAGIGTIVALVKAMAQKADPATIEQAVQDWLDDHPEATTTVEDGSITEAKLASDVIGMFSDIDDDIAEMLLSKPLANIYTPQDIADIMDGYILKNGVPQTQYGSGYYVTDYIPVDGGDTLNVNFITWGQGTDSSFRAAEYNSEKTYIKNITSFPHTLSSNAAYIRLSVKKNDFGGSAATALAYINENFVLSNGEKTQYTGIDETKNVFQSVDLARKQDTYFVDASSNEILIMSKMLGKSNKDVGLKMKNFTNNNSFQFCSFGTVDNDSPFTCNDPTEYVEYMSTSEDFFSPIVAYAEENIDGDDPENGHFTGGMHKFNGYNTARLISLDIYYDGRKIPGFVGYCNTIDIIIKQNLQVSNTLKNDGTGREAVTEITKLHFENGVIYTESELIALEPIDIQTFYFMQGNHKADKMGSGGIRYIGSEENRAINSMDSVSESGDFYCRTMRMLSTVLQMDITIDNVDLGRFSHVTSPNASSAFTNVYSGYSKCYFNAIRSTDNMVHLDTGCSCVAKGNIRLGIFE